MRGLEHFVVDELLEGYGLASDSFAKAASRMRFWKEISIFEVITKGRRSAQTNDSGRL